MVPGQERKRMEDRFGEIGHGLTDLTIQGTRYDLYQLLRVLGLDHADIRPIDAHYVEGSEVEGSERFAIRYFDFEERVIVAFEFDSAFGYLGEHRAHIDEWMGEDYYNFPWAIFCPESI